MIYHAHSHYRPKDPESLRRMNLAGVTWNKQPWVDFPVEESGGRLYTDSIGSVPFVKDILDSACKGRSDNDIVVFTNSDTCVSGNCSFLIAAQLQVCDAAYCFRRDFQRLTSELSDDDIEHGSLYCGTDLKAFRVRWWRLNRDNFPDLLLGRESWDAIMRLLMGITHPGVSSELRNLIYHERHPTSWENPANRYTVKSQLHNIALAKTWLKLHNIKPSAIGL